MIRTIGLTGGFGTGKTTVLLMFKAEGARVLDSDRIVHQEFAKNNGLKKKIASIFGPLALKSGKVDRRFLAENVFRDSSALKKLNQLLHPLVKKRIKYEICKGAGLRKDTIVVVEVPLLFEAGFDKIFDVNVVVAAGPAIQKKRMLKDGRFSQEDLRLRSRFQMPLAAKLKACDFVIDNTRDKNSTLKQVKKLVELLGKKP